MASKFLAFLLVAAFVVTGAATGGVSLAGVPSGIAFVISDCCSPGSEVEEPDQETRLERTCCCRPAPFSEILLEAPSALSNENQRELGVLALESFEIEAPAPLAGSLAPSVHYARGPPGTATSLFSQRTSLLI